jgi:4-oxalocrotonate tautomerase
MIALHRGSSVEIKNKERRSARLVHFLYWPDSLSELAEPRSGGQFPAAERDRFPNSNKQRKESVMPLVDIHLIEGAFDKSQKQAMIDKVTNAMLEVEGEAMRGVTWVRVYEVASGEWAIGGKALSAADVKAMRARPQ